MNSAIRIMLAAVALGVCANQSLAVMPHVFIGGNVQWNQPTGDFGDAQDDVEESIRQGNASGVMGGQVDLGLTSNMGQIYAGYRIVDFDERQSNGDVEWRDNSRALAGVRWFILPTPITPTLGGGLSVGQTKGVFKQPGPVDDLIEELTSPTTVGWFLEGGAAVRLPQTPLGLNAELQYHRYNASFESEYVDIDFSISYLTYQLGAQFNF